MNKLSTIAPTATSLPRLVSLLVFLTFDVGCARDGPVSAAGYQYTKALYSVCNRHDQPRLTQVAEQIDAAGDEAELTASEVDRLHAIVATAQAGAWQAATQDARRLMEAQVVGR